MDRNKKQKDTQLLLTELINNYSPVYPEPYSWDNTFDYMMNDEHEKAIVDQLVSFLQNGETFRKPIILGAAEFVENVETQAVLDGTHRVIAHMLHNTQTPLHVLHENDRVNNEEEFTQCLSTALIFHNSLTDEESDNLHDILRSFPLHENMWLTTSCSTMNNHLNTLHIMWDEDNINEINYELLHNRIKEILQKYNILHKLVNIQTQIEDY